MKEQLATAQKQNKQTKKTENIIPTSSFPIQTLTKMNHPQTFPFPNHLHSQYNDHNTFETNEAV